MAADRGRQWIPWAWCRACFGGEGPIRIPNNKRWGAMGPPLGPGPGPPHPWGTAGARVWRVARDASPCYWAGSVYRRCPSVERILEREWLEATCCWQWGTPPACPSRKTRSTRFCGRTARRRHDAVQRSRWAPFPAWTKVKVHEEARTGPRRGASRFVSPWRPFACSWWMIPHCRGDPGCTPPPQHTRRPRAAWRDAPRDCGPRIVPWH